MCESHSASKAELSTSWTPAGLDFKDRARKQQMSEIRGRGQAMVC